LLKTAFANQINSMKRLEALVEKKIRDVLQEAGLMVQVNRCMKVEGIGFLTAARLVTSYQRGEFSGANAFIAFLGLDLRVSKSGQRDGPRRLTKRGDPEARRLLHNAAMSGSRTPAWKPFYEEQRKRGFSTTQALVMLARKMALANTKQKRLEGFPKTIESPTPYGQQPERNVPGLFRTYV
ncbi:transposase, partial [Pseudomonas syringae]|uniref:transposase n=1 Tax=Pseudomonas syringae TaxID=317 RepID=UPI001E53B166